MAFSHRREAKSRTYLYELSGSVALAPVDEARFRKYQAAWAFFEAQPPSYRKLVVLRILSAKRQATRDKRLTALIAASAKGGRMT